MTHEPSWHRGWVWDRDDAGFRWQRGRLRALVYRWIDRWAWSIYVIAESGGRVRNVTPGNMHDASAKLYAPSRLQAQRDAWRAVLRTEHPELSALTDLVSRTKGEG